MKRVILTVFSLFLLLFCYNACKPSIDEVDQIATMAKVWGFLKYYHPGVMNGSIDWDNQLIISLEKIDKRLSLADFEREIVRLINQAGELEISKNKASESKDRSSSKGEIIWIEDFSWLEKDRLLDKSLKEKLKRIKDDVVREKQYYVQSVPGVGNTDYKNEKPYADMTYPSTEFRLLALARFWNIINYFYPYKLIMDKNWHEVLTEFIPKFKNAQNAVEYHLAVLELTTRLNDTHASARSKVITDYFGNFFAPFQTRCIEGKMVVTRIRPSLNSTNDIKVGDIIKKIEGRDVSDMLPEALHYLRQ